MVISEERAHRASKFLGRAWRRASAIALLSITGLQINVLGFYAHPLWCHSLSLTCVIVDSPDY